MQRYRLRNRHLTPAEARHARVVCEIQERSRCFVLGYAFRKWANYTATCLARLSCVARRENRATRERMVDLFDFRLRAAVREFEIYKNVPHPKGNCLQDCRFRIAMANESYQMWRGNGYSEEVLDNLDRYLEQGGHCYELRRGCQG